MNDPVADTRPDVSNPTSTDAAEPKAGRCPRRRHPIRLAAVGAFAVAVLLAIALARGLEQGRSVSSPLLGQPAPYFDLPLLDGESAVDLARLRGGVTVVNFWASWCPPCRTEAPHLESFARRLAPAGVQVVGILYNDDLDAARRFRDEFGLTYPLVNDPGGQVAFDYGVAGVPETFLIDESGIVVAKIIGAVGPTTLDDILAQAAAGATVETRGGGYLPSP